MKAIIDYSQLNRASATRLSQIAKLAVPLAFAVALCAQSSNNAPPPTTHTVTTTGGSANHVAKFSGTSTIVNSAIYENGGKVGIGTTSPSTTLTVNGLIRTMSGGVEFPDGTTQSTAAHSGLSAVSHDTTLVGNGTSSSKLGVAVPLDLFGNTGGETVFVDNSGSGYGLAAETSSTTAGGLFGYSPGTSSVTGEGVGVYGESSSGVGVFGASYGWIGVLGYTDTNYTWATEGYIVGGTTDATAIFGRNDSGSGNGYGGYFTGDVYVSGNLAKSSGSFKIDDPLDPANKYLYHSFVESPDMMNIYNGNVMTDASGLAMITMPDYFSALNRDFRYQLTVIGQFAQAIVASKLADNRFTIKTDKPNVEVSWQVTGIRQDAWANAHRLPVEIEKPLKEQGSYLHPELYNEGPEKSVEMAMWPEQMQKMNAKAQPRARR